MAKSPSDSVPVAMRIVYDPLVTMLDAFCAEHLNDEYALLARRLAAALARKRPSPLTRGALEVWAGGIVHALGTVNFLFDASQTPHLSTSELCDRLGLKQSTVGNRAKVIRDLCKMGPFDHRWCLPSRMEANAPIWYVQLDGYLVDARTLPRALQAVAFEKGLIPWIPADRAPTDGAAG